MSNMEEGEVCVEVVNKGMKGELYHAALSGSFESHWKESETFTRNNILHIHVGKPIYDEKAIKYMEKSAAHKKRLEMVSREFLEKVVQDEGYSLLWKVNSNGDTPLHVAARFGHDNAVEAFLARAKAMNEEEVTRMVKIINVKKDTALHEAARFGHADVVKLLLRPEFNCCLYDDPNEEGETPLYLAAERGSTSSVVAILEACDPSAPVITYRGPCGRTALHAAVQWGSPEMVERLLDKDSWVLKVQNDKGLTPFHSIASETYISNLDIVNILKILLKYDRKMESSALYIRDNEGRSALHIAMLRRNWKAMKLLIESCPDIIEVVDNQGRNVAHYAAKWTSQRTLHGLLRTGHLDKLINDKDVDGNTPLHILVNFDKEKDPKQLAPSSSVRLNWLKDRFPFLDFKAYNNKNQTIGDMLLSLDMFLHQKIFRGETFRGRRINAYDKDLEIVKTAGGLEGRSDKSLKKTAETHLVVAALIATVSFTAGFTLPGGLDQNNGKDIGMAILRNKTSFKVFLASDTIAFITSIIAVILYFLVAALKGKGINKILSKCALVMITISLVALMIAFLSGVFAVLSKSLYLVILIALFSPTLIYFYILLFAHSMGNLLSFKILQPPIKLVYQ